MTNNYLKCNNCGNNILENDRFCRYCGTKKGEGSYNPEDDIIADLYGPPTYEYHICGNCGRRFKMIIFDISNAYCPECAKKSDKPVLKDTSWDYLDVNIDE